MSLRFGLAANSDTAGRGVGPAVVLGAGAGVGVAAGAGVGSGLLAGAGVTAVGAGAGGVVAWAAPVGAGADAAVIAGRLAQPARTTTLIRRESMSAFRQRLAMVPPFRSRHSRC